MERIYDYIIIGSGSAGSALAYRLGADGKRRILVLEFGGSDAGPLIQMPAALSYPMNMKRYDWGYLAEPEPALGGRRLAQRELVLAELLREAPDHVVARREGLPPAAVQRHGVAVDTLDEEGLACASNTSR